MQVKTIFNVKMFVHDFDDYISNVIRHYGCWEPNLTEFIIYLHKKHDISNKIIFDVGANIGYYSLLCSALDNTNQIHAFEPLKINYELIDKTIDSQNIKNIKVNKHCIGNKDNEKLYLSFDETNMSKQKHFNIGGTLVVSNSNTETFSLTLDTYIKENKDHKILVFEPCILYPYYIGEKRPEKYESYSYAVHHWGASWC